MVAAGRPVQYVTLRTLIVCMILSLGTGLASGVGSSLYFVSREAAHQHTKDCHDYNDLRSSFISAVRKLEQRPSSAPGKIPLDLAGDIPELRAFIQFANDNLLNRPQTPGQSTSDWLDANVPRKLC